MKFTLLRLLLATLVLTCGKVRADEALLIDGTRGYADLSGEWAVLPIDGLSFNFPPPAGGAWKKEHIPGFVAALKEDATPYGGNLAEYLTKDKTALRRPTGDAAWFKRSFLIPKSLRAGQRARLYFGGMAFKSEVWLNGRKLGGSMLGQVPSFYDIGGMLRAGANELVVGLTGRTGLIDLANQTFLAPTWGVGAGIWGKVELQFLPAASIEKVFVNTSVKEKRISFDVRIVNAGKDSARVVPEVAILDAQQHIQTRFAGDEVTVSPGEVKQVTLKKDWIAPQLWCPSNAALYFARVSLQAGPMTLDSRTIRFGFREFEIRGREFYLNGVRTTLLRNSYLTSLTGTRSEIFAQVRAMAGQPYNCVRLHGGFDCEDLLDLCDELGVMAIPEGAWHQADVSKFNLEKCALWLPNVEDYYKKLIEHDYNHPSIVMWSLTNETYWGKTDPERMKIADRLMAVARQADASRPVQGDAEVTWGGRLPVINIHYPEASVENSLRSKYPNSAFVFPNDYYWLRKDGENGSWRAGFKWDRPLVIGEYWYPSGEADSKTAFMGESVYDWEKWRMERMDGCGDENRADNEFVRSQQGLADAYRIQGVAGINPWASDARKVMPALAVRPVDFHPNFFGGTTGSRKFVVYNDTGVSYADMDLQCRLAAHGQTLWETRIPAPVGPGEMKVFELKLDCPAVTHQVKAALTVRLRSQKGGGMYQLDRFEDTVFLMPRSNLANLSATGIRLLDTTGATAKALAGMGLELTPLAKLTSAELKGVKVVVVGEGTDASPCKDALVEFVTDGGSVIVLRNDEWTPLTSELPAIDKQHVSTRSWLRTFNHPITAGLDDGQFSYWRPDHLVSLKTFRKPSGGNCRSLLDCGGLYGLNWTPLVEVPLGRGSFVLTSLDLVGRLDAEPAAGRLLEGMLRYAVTFKPTGVLPLRLLAGEQRPLRASLKAAGVAVEEGLAGTGPILLDASFEISPAQLAEIRGYLVKGGNLWLHGFSTQTLGKVAALFPFMPLLKPYDATVQSAARRSEDSWINNLSSQDFFWTKVDLEARSDYFGAARPTALLGGEVLQLPTVQSGVRLIEPALLVKVPVGNGAILFDTLAWDKALGAETDKVTRIASSLATNLGVEVRSTVDKTQYDYFAVDLKPYANMGYYDRVANYGKGGWTDEGENDMRFFLINHVGKTGGVESGMETEAEPFPAQVTFAGHPFSLTDPRKTDNHSILSLRGGEHGARLPSEIKGVEVGRKADKLWFLHAAGWAPKNPNQEVARYVFHYADGTESSFPVRFEIEVGDYYSPKPLGGATVAWTGRNLVHSPVGIYCAEWTNPYPDKVVATLDVIGNLAPTQFLVVAISGGIVTSKEPRAEAVSEWQLGEYAGGEVRNRIPGGDVLRAGDCAPGIVANTTVHALKFENGQSLVGRTESIPRLGGFGKQPFAIRMTISPTSRPGGFCGGLFEAAVYGKTGFRMTLGNDMKLGVEDFSDTGIQCLSSRTVLEIGRRYTVELRFDGTYATLLIDGQTDAIKEMPMPAPFSGPFRIGVAAGKEYFFNGIVFSASIWKLPVSAGDGESVLPTAPRRSHPLKPN